MVTIKLVLNTRFAHVSKDGAFASGVRNVLAYWDVAFQNPTERSRDSCGTHLPLRRAYDTRWKNTGGRGGGVELGDAQWRKLRP